MFKKSCLFSLFLLLFFSVVFSVSSCKKDDLDSAVKSNVAINYLSEADYLSGNTVGKLKNEAEISIGEKIYAVIDCTLSEIKNLEEGAMATVKLNLSSEKADFDFEIEEVPTSDFVKNTNGVEATFKIHDSNDNEKTFRFIFFITAKGAGNIDLSATLSSDCITAAKHVQSRIKVNHNVLSASKLAFKLSSDEKYYTVTGLGDEKGDVITIPTNYNSKPVLEIADNVFSGVVYLKEIILPEKLEKIGTQAFKGCTGLKNIIIPTSVAVIGDGAFSDCPNTDIYCETSAKPTGWKDNWASSDAYVTWSYHDNFLYKNSNGTYYYEFEYKNPNGENVSVPSTYQKLPVLSVSFSSCSEIKKIKLPETVTTLHDYSFKGCNNLCEITVSNENTKYQSTYGVLYTKDGKTLVKYAARKTDSSFTVPDTVENIAPYAFENCTDIVSVTLPESLSRIDSTAFYGCFKLIEVINGSSISVKASDYGLSAFEVHKGLSKLSDKNGYLFYTHNGENYLLGYTGNDTKLVLPSNYNGENYKIYKNAFYGKAALTDVAVPSSVNFIGFSAFEGCNTLTNVTLPFIGMTASEGESSHFGYIFGATSYLDNNKYIPLSLKKLVVTNAAYIGSNAFYQCVGLKSIVIPESVVSIGNNAFRDCTALSEIKFNATNCSDLASLNYVFYNVGTSTDGITVTFGDNVKRIPAYLFCAYSSAFYAPNIKTVILGKGITSISPYAFAYCNKLTKITVPNTVTSIGSNSFAYCTALTGIDIPSSITSIGAYSFAYCSGLKIIEVPETVVSIGNGAFSDCTALTEIKFNAANCSDLPRDNYVFYNAGTGSDGITVIFGDNVKRIPAWLFCPYITFEAPKPPVITNLKTVIIGKGVKNIGTFAFAFCSKITSVEIPSNVTSIGDSAFYDCDSLTSVVIGNSVTSIASFAFNSCASLTSIKYRGTEAQWNEISKGSSWKPSSATITYNYKGE